MRPGERLGDYRLERALGEGGMKSVWRAIDLRDGQEVALAVLHSFAPDLFHNEVALARRVTSPHVARVIDGFVTPEGHGVVISELCEGLDLQRYRQAHELDAGAAVAIAHQMAIGLCAIHAAHVLHRDVKPANAILTAGGVKMIDFGVSLPAVDMHTGVEGGAPPAGTLPYMAPETLGGDIDARSDTYALGISLFQLLTGDLPLPGLSFHHLMLRLVERAPVPLDRLTRFAPQVRWMVARLCEAEVARRPYVADIVEELGALARLLGGAVPAVVATGASPPVWRDTVHDGDLPPAIPPTFYLRDAPARIAVRVVTRDPGAVIVGWPHMPILALVHGRGGTDVRAYDLDGLARWYVHVNDDLRGGLVADLDGDGVGELYVWSARRVHVIDAAARLRYTVETPPRPGAMPWDDGAPAPLVMEGAGGANDRRLAVGNAWIDPITRAAHNLPGGWEGEGDALVDARGVTGLSCHGGARQRFRGDVGTAAAILAAPRQPGFVVAALERIFDDGPTVKLGLWGPGGRRVGGGEVGRYALQTAPPEMCERAQRRDHALFPPDVAPLAIVGTGRSAEDVIVVPYLINAPWFGPLLVGFDGTGAERWRERLPGAVPGPAPAPPILVDLDGSGQPQLLWADAMGTMHRRDARTGAAAVSPALNGAPVAALDLGGRGVLQLITWSPDAIELIPCGPCLPGAIHWIPPRGDLWRSGTLGPEGLPVGPRF